MNIKHYKVLKEASTADLLDELLHREGIELVAAVGPEGYYKITTCKNAGEPWWIDKNDTGHAQILVVTD